ncbi:M4 family metallopeptidase [Streptomyces sp. NPDC058691]|uniref:M4 family metallopeptidase n=1 Tax=Streptomyces sp. NPDC058691 TaxID=3346601 RepID=UPI0036486118
MSLLRPNSRPRSGKTAAIALTAAAALLATAVPSGAALAAGHGHQAARTAAALRAGAAPAKLTPSARASLIRTAAAGTGVTAKALGLGSRERLVVKDVVKDADGTLHTRYERTYAGLPVLGGDLVVHRDGARLTQSRATRAAVSVPSTRPASTAAAAAKKAVAATPSLAAKARAAGTPRLVVWAATGKPALAWETVVDAVQADGTPSELHVVTDARTGKELSRQEGVKTGTGTGAFVGTVPLGTTASGGTYQLKDGTRGGHYTTDLNNGTSSGTGTLFTDADDVWGDGTVANRQSAGVDAHFGAAATWDYYKDTFGRNGIYNDGDGRYSRTHYGSNYVNAYWSDTCRCMTYGDGSGNTHPLTAIDVAGHEMSHGVTSATAGLNYSGESGGLNEATSDIFGSMVEFHANLAADTPDYLIGEEIDINGDGTPLRYMDKPSRDGDSADYWSSSLGGLDVHYSSGPANHFFYLLAEGSGAKTINGVAYDSPTYDGVPVPGIGASDAAAIWYRALTTYMTSTTDYAGARTATLQAAADLFGAYSPTYVTVANTWAAINVGRRIVDGIDLIPPGDQLSGVGQAVSLQIEATTSNVGATLEYTAGGLPDGLSLDPATGLITGTPTATGTADVVLTVTDSTGDTASTGFTWTVAYVYGNGTRVDIPDVGPAVESPITVSGRGGNASAVTQVYVKIVHTWRGDLTVDLVGPSGTVHSLLNRSGGSADNVDQTFTVDASAETVDGTWKLRVRDLASLDTGYIEKWTLTP